MSFGDEAPVNIHAIKPCEQRAAGFPLQHLTLGNSAIANVWRIGNDEVDGFGGQGGEQIAKKE